jgi:hypothetical protein
MTESSRPMLRVISGDATDEEIAALIAVFAAAGTADTETSNVVAPSQWATPGRLHRAAVHPGPDGSWWASGLPC